MRALNEGELLRLAEQVIRYDIWHQYVQFAQDVYGPHAYTVQAETYSEYDDEGGYFDVVGDVAVLDREGSSLDPDPSTDWWQEQLASYQGEEYDVEEDPDDLAYDRKSQLPAMDATCCVDDPPERTYAEVFVRN